LKILYFCPQQVWPLTGGALLRNFHLANALASRCSVTLLQLARPGEQPAINWPATNFRQVLTFERDSAYTPAKVLNGIIGPAPLPVLNYASKSAAAALSSLLARESFDAVQLESVHLLSYLDAIRQAPRSPAVVADWHNIESELMARYASQTRHWARRIAAKRTASLLERAEQRLLAEADVHTVVSEREKQALLKRLPGAKIHVIPNGVDMAAFAGIDAAVSPDDPAPARNTVLYVGSMDYHANVDAVTWFVREIWPKVEKQLPDLTFTIAGRNPGPGVRALASPRVRVTGSVEDVRPYYAAALAVVVPLRVGSGTRLKILEAMAAGVPVVSTSLGAEGLDAVDAIHLLLADSPEQISSSLGRILQQPGLARDLSDAAKAFVAQRYDWSLIGQKLYEIHREVYVSVQSSKYD
jgi:sugar transferase (PEP-CTERM/EpsH1 system associated)